MMNKNIIIDGSYGEGGGQILRTSISLSAVLGIPVKIKNIRIKRNKPGLRPQHLTGIIAASKITNAEVKGAFVGSTTIEFIPKDIIAGDFKFDTGTAGSLTLVMQVLLPIMLFSPGKIKANIKGGTHVTHSPSYDYFKEVLLSAVGQMGAKVKTEVIKYGFYPKGGGEISIECNGRHCSELTGLRLDEDYKNTELGWTDKNMVKGRIVQSDRLPEHIIEREINTINELFDKKGFSSDIERVIANTYSPGTAITLWYNYNGYRGSYALGEIGKPAEKVAQEAVNELIKHADYTIGRYLADQLMIFGALAKGNTRIYTSEISSHTKTNAYVINSFLPDTIKIIDGNHMEIKGRIER